MTAPKTTYRDFALIILFRCYSCPRKVGHGLAKCSLHSPQQSTERGRKIGRSDVAESHKNDGEGACLRRCSTCGGAPAVYGVGGGGRYLFEAKPRAYIMYRDIRDVHTIHTYIHTYIKHEDRLR